MARRSGSTTRTRRTYRWWQWLLRGGLVAGAVVVIGYASLPLWLPTGWVARRLADDLSDQFGAPVMVGDVSISWSEGIRIASITLADPTDPTAAALITTGMVRADFSPLRLMLARRIAWVQIEAPQVRLATDARGQWNIAALKTPTMDVWVERIAIRRGVVRLDADPDVEPVQLEISDLQCRSGRRSPIGSVSGSAALLHGSRRAPIALSIAVGYSAAGAPRPVLKCTFSGLDLAHLGLIDRLGLPLARMEGVCKGSLNLPVADGAISKATASLAVDGLAIQPTVGPALPTIDSAGIQLAGDIDLATRQVDVQSMHLRGPGIILDGQARFHAALLQGAWLSGEHLSVTAAVNPRALGTLLRGADRPALDPYDVAGDVQVRIDYAKRDDQITSSLSVDATAAAMSSSEGVVKPAGEMLVCSLAAQCQVQTWQFVVDRTELRLGGNRFVGRGALANIRRLLTNWVGPEHRWTLQEVGEELTDLNWYAEWEVNELESLRRLGPIPRRILAAARLDGRLTGVARVQQQEVVRLHINAECDENTELVVGPWFAKPPRAALAVAADLAYDRQSRRMGESTLSLTCGGGQATVRLTDVTLSRSPEGRVGPVGAWVADVRGTTHAEQVEQIAACVTDAAGWGRRLSGAVSGEFAVAADPDALGVVASIDATPLAIRAGDIVDKPVGEPVHLTCTALWAWPRGPVTAAVDAAMPGSELTGRWIGERRQWTAEARLAITDAAWLSRQIPWLSHPDHPLAVSGAADVHVDIAQRGDALSVRANAAADDLALDWRGGERRKLPGAPLRVRVAAGRARDSDAPLRWIEIDEAAIEVGGITARVAGTLLEADRIDDTTVNLAGEWSMSLDDSTFALLPELVPWADRWGLCGSVLGRASLGGRRQSFLLAGQIDATDLAVAANVGDGTIAKPAGIPAALTWSAEAEAEGGVSSITIGDWTGRLGPLRAMGDARVLLPPGGDVSARSHVRLWTSHPDQLGFLHPEVAARRPTGTVRLEGQVSYDAGSLAAAYVRTHLTDLAFIHRGRRVTLDGAATVSEIAPADGDPSPVSVGRVHTDGLTLAAADSAATLVADLHDLPAATRGSAALLASHIDATDLRTWLAGSAELPQRTPEYSRQLVATAEAVVDAAKRWGPTVDLDVAADIGLLTDFPDDKVGELYDAHNVSLRASLKAGELNAAYTAGVNGGTLIDRFSTDLNAAEPQLRHVNTIREMMATKSLQPQIAAFFPGNEVRGYMWREMDLRRPLAAALANGIDPRHPAPPQGWGTTTLIEGVTRGRAAPLYVTRLFPGLNLVEYPYERMVAFTEFNADGTAHNDMVFTGKTYNMYIEGDTDADGVALYDVGLILGRTRDSAEWHHRYKQGRVPLLEHSLRIVDGRKADEVVSFPWPNEAVFSIFVKNNYFYRLWLHRQKPDADGK